jgi:phage baseplate assembly protein W
VLLTAPGERINRPEFGAGVRRLVFAPLSPATASLAQTTIYQALTAWLDALIRVEDVRAQTIEPGRLDITVTYLLRARGERRFLNVEVTE